jgi:anthraniloyl-CoA monooxygenase
VKVRIVGAGPAGLYLAILLKKADPNHDVAVLERNAPDATFGWGVVFSEETLGSLRDADPESHLQITDTFARWPAIDIHYRGQRLRSRGHAFSAIARKLLLQILQRRARELGVELRFETEVGELPKADLVVGADGVKSGVRAKFASDFGERVSPQGCKYVWFGTDLVLDAFTFIFKETDAGLVQVHAYPFDEHTSTWIVECPEHTWRALGFDEMDEAESLKACEELFATELRGHRLMTNRSLWLDFLLVRNESWHRGNIVLLGDAAHTAHFSIGSGTKLAMEDAIALAHAFQRHPDDLERALVDYELERQPVVERFQLAAGESAAYFSRVERYAHMDPMPFAFNLLTRSGRITHANLAQRDPQFVRVLDASFHGGVESAVAPPPLFAPWHGLRNRIVRATAAPEEAAGLARSGAGMVLVGPVAATADGRISPVGRARRGGPRGRCAGGRAAHPRRAPRLDAPPRPRPAAARGWLATGRAVPHRLCAAHARSDRAGCRCDDERPRWVRGGGAPRCRRGLRRTRARHGPRLPAGVVPVPRVQPARR